VHLCVWKFSASPGFGKYITPKKIPLPTVYVLLRAYPLPRSRVYRPLPSSGWLILLNYAIKMSKYVQAEIRTDYFLNKTYNWVTDVKPYMTSRKGRRLECEVYYEHNAAIKITHTLRIFNSGGPCF
jgi:hypothetical protein